MSDAATATVAPPLGWEPQTGLVVFLPNGSFHDEDIPALRRSCAVIGIRLVLSSDPTIWSFCPEEDLERFLTAGPRHAEVCSGARRRHRIGGSQSAILIVDGEVRFRHASRLPVRTALLDALEAVAGHARSLPRPAVLRCLSTSLSGALAST